MTALKKLNLENVNIENGTIPAQAFQNKVMEKITLPSSLKKINAQAFKNATVDRFDFSACPDLEYIGSYTFENAKFSGNLDFSKNSKLTTGFASSAFSQVTCQVTLPSNMTELPQQIFNSFIGSVVLPEGLLVINNMAFIGAKPQSPLVFPSKQK